MPTYNRAHLIVESLESVFAQSYQDYEVIVVDDGSTDNTEEVLAPYLDRIRYIKQENAGVSAARNHGIFEAKGEYIAFLDSDDLWFPEKLEKQMKVFQDYPTCAFVCCNAMRGPSLSDPATKLQFASRPDSVLDFDLFATANYVGTPTVLVKKHVFYRAGLFDTSFRVGEDFDLWVRIARHFECRYLAEPLGFFRDHEDNTMGNHLKRIDGARVRELQSVRWKRHSPEISKQYLRYASQMYAGLAYHLRKQGLRKETLQNYKNAIRCCCVLSEKLPLAIRYLIYRFFPLVFREYNSRNKD